MTQELANDRQAKTRRNAYARVSVPKIMQPDVVQPRGGADVIPWPFEIMTRAVRPIAGDHKLANTRTVSDDV